jgi:proton-dependent oligopeptide transporter, POT family
MYVLCCCTMYSCAPGTEHKLDRAKTEYGGSFSKLQVDGVKLVTRLLPYLALMVPYWGLYSQMSTAFQNQGCQMNLKLAGTEIPVSALNCFDTLAILVLVPVFDQTIYPYFKKIGYPLTMLRRIGMSVDVDGFTLVDSWSLLLQLRCSYCCFCCLYVVDNVVWLLLFSC